MNTKRFSDDLKSLLRACQSETRSEWTSFNWRPAVDIYESPRGWLVKLELAGVAKEEVTLRLQGRTLLIHGRRRDIVLIEGWKHQAMEICYSEFERSVELPGDLERTRIETDYRDGMLLIHILNEERLEHE